MAERPHGAPTPATDTEIVGADRYGADLAAQSHERVAFSEVDMIDSSSRGATFSECAFRECRFNASRHRDSAFLNCRFVRCTFFDASFVDCKLVGSMFDRCELGVFTCEGGDWSFVGLPGADLRRARFSGVRMREADLTGARCAGALLHEVDLSGASLHRVDFSGADLRGSDISALDPATVELRGTIVDPDQTMVIAAALGLDVRPEDRS